MHGIAIHATDRNQAEIIEAIELLGDLTENDNVAAQEEADERERLLDDLLRRAHC